MTNPLTPRIELKQVKGGSNPGWYMTHLGKESGPGQYPAIKIDYDRTADFTFTIKSGADFSTDPKTGPISIQKGNAKPTGGGVDNQITITNQSAKVLQFNDSNKQKGDLNYVLHFSDGSQLDPIIDNGGCCQVDTGFWSQTRSLANDATFEAWVAIAFVAGILVTLGARRLMGRGSNSARTRSGPQ